MSRTRMKDAEQSHQQLVRQLEELRSRVVELEAAKKEWHQTAEALRRSEEAFRTIFDHSNDGILVGTVKLSKTRLTDPPDDGVESYREREPGMLGVGQPDSA